MRGEVKISEIKNNEVEQNKSPETSPRTVSEGDGAKLKPAGMNEGSVEHGKEKETDGKDSSKGEHPKLSTENDAGSQGKGDKPEATKNDNPHRKLSTGEANAEKEKQPVTDDPNAKKTGDGNGEKEQQPVSDDPNAKKTGEANPKIKNPPEDGNGASDKREPPVEKTVTPSEDVSPRNLPVLSIRAPLREDLPEGTTKDGNIGGYPVKFANWDPAFAKPEDAMKNKILEPGTYYRYGGPDGNFITKREPGQTLENLYGGLALPYEYDPSKWSVVDVKEPLQNVHCGEVGKQRKFGEDGGGWQAELPHAIWKYPSDKVSMRPLREEENW